jgi:hypothetical protein
MLHNSRLCWALALAAQTLLAQSVSPLRIFRLSEVRAGQTGVGRTVFSGDRIEEFQVHILGILRNAGPKQSIILARLSGGPLAETGVLQGMSGSPVYVDGRLVGAVALSFPNSKEPIAGIRPIEDMLKVEEAPASAPRAARNPLPANSEGLREISTPISFSGFTQAALDHFAPQLAALGLTPCQGVSSGADLPSRMGNPANLHPGGMISVELLSGDMSAGADGTVTAIDGHRVYAFGHPFLAGGATDLPFARAEVLALLPSRTSSFKISAPREWMGAITEDRGAAVAGILGRTASLAPLNIRVIGEQGAHAYKMRVVSDRAFAPLLTQMAVFSAITATERAAGPVAYELRGQADFAPGIPPLKLNNAYAGDFAVAALAALGVAAPLNSALNAGYDALRLTRIDLEVRASETHRIMNIAQVAATKTQAAPGDEVTLLITFSGHNGIETQRKLRYKIPIGATAGPLQFVVSDASTANASDYLALSTATPRDAARVVELLNTLRDNRKAYVRVLRSEASFTVRGETLPDPPPSYALILAKAQSVPGITGAPSKLAEFPIDAGGDLVSGAQSVTIQVKP